jgi:hypothetical protein
LPCSSSWCRHTYRERYHVRGVGSRPILSHEIVQQSRGFRITVTVESTIEASDRWITRSMITAVLELAVVL